MKTIRVEVVYALPQRQWTVQLVLSEGSTVREALQIPAVQDLLEECEDESTAIGIWGREVSLNHSLRDADRIELYRKLQADPKAARRQRARRSTGKR